MKEGTVRTKDVTVKYNNAGEQPFVWTDDEVELL